MLYNVTNKVVSNIFIDCDKSRHVEISRLFSELSRVVRQDCNAWRALVEAKDDFFYLKIK